MLFKIEKKGNRYIIVNDPPVSYDKFDILVSENSIIDRSDKSKKPRKQQTKSKKIIELRKKYPELKTLDDLTSGWNVFKKDDDLLDEYFNQRAKDEGIV